MLEPIREALGRQRLEDLLDAARRERQADAWRGHHPRRPLPRAAEER